jgi:hypothetical protein
MNVFISDPMIATVTTPKSAIGGTGRIRDRMAMPEKPMPRRTSASTYLSTIQSKTAPKRVSFEVFLATLPSIRSSTAERKSITLPARKSCL